MSPPPLLAVFDSQIRPTTRYTHLPAEDAITRDRRAVAINATSTTGAGSSSTLTSTTAAASYQRLPPPPPLSRSLFSSSSSSDGEARSDSIHLKAAPALSSPRRNPKKLRRLPLPPTSASQLKGGIQSKKSHRRSMSYGSAREMLLRGTSTALFPTSGQVQQCSTCLQPGLSVEGSGGVGDRGDPEINVRPLPTVPQFEEALEGVSVIQMDEESEEETLKERHLYLQNVSSSV